MRSGEDGRRRSQRPGDVREVGLLACGNGDSRRGVGCSSRICWGSIGVGARGHFGSGGKKTRRIAGEDRRGVGVRSSGGKKDGGGGGMMADGAK